MAIKFELAYKDALQYLAAYIISSGPSKPGCSYCLVPEWYQNCGNYSDSVVASHDAVNKEINADRSITHFKVFWESLENKTAKIQFFSSDAYGAGANEKMEREEIVKVFS